MSVGAPRDRKCKAKKKFLPQWASRDIKHKNSLFFRYHLFITILYNDMMVGMENFMLRKHEGKTKNIKRAFFSRAKP